MRFALIVAEVSLTSLLLVGAGLLLRSFERVLSQPAGIETDGPPHGDGDAAAQPLSGCRRGAARAARNRDAPAQHSGRDRGRCEQPPAAERRGPPGRHHGRRLRAAAEAIRRSARTRAWSRPATFRALGIQLAEGRLFTDADTATAPLVVVINDTMARRYWPGSSPLGKRMRFNGANEPWREVVGVIKDVRHWGLDREVNPEVYMPHEQQPSATMSFVLHASVPPATLVPDVTRLVQDFDPNLPLGATRTMEDVAARSMAARRWSAVLLGSFALLALVLAGVGIYGVMAHLVSTRTSEIGIRLTLGARPGGVLRQILGEGLLHTVTGLALGSGGVTCGDALARRALLFEVAADRSDHARRGRR